MIRILIATLAGKRHARLPDWGPLQAYMISLVDGVACALWLLCLAETAGTHGNSSQDPSVSEHALVLATDALQRGDHRDSIRLLKSVMPLPAGNPRAWHVLGTAFLKTHDASAAVETFRAGLAREHENPQLLYDLGLAYCQRGDIEQAFAAFTAARATHRVDMSRLDVDSETVPLRVDPRYRALLPQPEDFMYPFVEDVHIIHEWDGEHAGDQFGWIARVIGDVDRDGFKDFVTSAPGKDIGGENAGRVYAYSGRSGASLWSVDGAPGDELGSGIEAAGDTDADGVPDVIASAPGIDTAYVYSGADGHRLLSLHGEARGDRFGEHVAGAGDIDGDGHADVIIGAPKAAANGAKSVGRAYVYSGKDGRRLLTLTGERPGDQFGSTVAGFSDDRHRILVVGAPGAGAHHHGRVYVYEGLSRHPKWVFDADASGVALGYMFVSVVGDVDGDGEPDIFASDWANSARGWHTGRGYMYSGRTGKTLLTLTGETPGEAFGTTHSVAGDVDGDGHADLIIGSWQYSEAAQSGGRAYLFDGHSGALLRTYTSRIAGDTFGFDAVGMGQTDENGEAELLITAGWSAIHGFHSGRIFLISSGIGASRAPPPPAP